MLTWAKVIASQLCAILGIGYQILGSDSKSELCTQEVYVDIIFSVRCMGAGYCFVAKIYFPAFSDGLQNRPMAHK